ncbi:MAG: hypothetical protein JWO91_568 [Acidobacteriaceae bacterium]|nr:hypothetical protein [Acidobacteriaceae bacterium]
MSAHRQGLDAIVMIKPVQDRTLSLEPQMKNVYHHRRPAIQEHNVSSNENMFAIGRRRRQLAFKIDGNSMNSCS